MTKMNAISAFQKNCAQLLPLPLMRKQKGNRLLSTICTIKTKKNYVKAKLSTMRNGFQSSIWNNKQKCRDKELLRKISLWRK